MFKIMCLKGKNNGFQGRSGACRAHLIKKKVNGFYFRIKIIVSPVIWSQISESCPICKNRRAFIYTFHFSRMIYKRPVFFTEHILTCQSKKSTDVNNEIIVTLSWLTGTLEWNKTIVKVFCNSCYDKSECLLWKKAFKQEEILPERGRNWFLYPINNELSSWSQNYTCSCLINMYVVSK